MLPFEQAKCDMLITSSGVLLLIAIGLMVMDLKAFATRKIIGGASFRKIHLDEEICLNTKAFA